MCSRSAARTAMIEEGPTLEFGYQGLVMQAAQDRQKSISLLIAAREDLRALRASLDGYDRSLAAKLGAYQRELDERLGALFVADLDAVR
jgi:hypothetical protein